MVIMLVKTCLPIIDLDDGGGRGVDLADGNAGRGVNLVDDDEFGVDLADQREGQVRGRAQHLLRHRCWQARVI